MGTPDSAGPRPAAGDLRAGPRLGGVGLRIALGLAVLTLAAPLWLPALGLALVVADPLAPADAVAPLAGDFGERVAAAAALVVAGYAPRLVITDLRPQADGSLASLSSRGHALAAGLLPGQLVQTERTVESTYTELVAIRDLALARGWRSLIVVTSPQHTRRARIQAREVFRDSGVAVIVRPVVGHGFSPATWWRRDNERTLTLTEYPKLLVYLLGYRG